MAIANVVLMVPVAIIAMCMIGMTVCIGVIVYNDAKARGMEATLWTLVALLVPSFVGVIIYLVVRSGYSGVACKNCGNQVKNDYTVCPSCGAQLKYVCQSCKSAVESDWTVCAKCGAQQPQNRPDLVKTASTAVNKKLWILLGVFAAIPVIIVLAYTVLMFVQ